MGRTKLEKSPMEVAQQKKKWADARNKRRRDNYSKDPAYRRSVNERNRSNYRESNDVDLRNCSRNLKRLSKLGQHRLIKSNGRTVGVTTFSIHELAKALGNYHHIVLYRWHREQKFPRPTHLSIEEGIFVYTYEEAEALLRVMSEHQKVKLYLHTRDQETIKKLFEVVASDG